MTFENENEKKNNRSDRLYSCHRNSVCININMVETFSYQQAEIILTTYSFTFSSQQEESISTSSANDFLKALDNIFIGACATVSYAEDTTSIRSGLVTVNVDKRATENTATTIYDVSCSNCSEITYPANVRSLKFIGTYIKFNFDNNPFANLWLLVIICVFYYPIKEKSNQGNQGSNTIVGQTGSLDFMQDKNYFSITRNC